MVAWRLLRSPITPLATSTGLSTTKAIRGSSTTTPATSEAARRASRRAATAAWTQAASTPWSRSAVAVASGRLGRTEREARDRFRAAHPEFDVRIDATDKLVDFSGGGVDVGLRGNGPLQRDVTTVNLDGHRVIAGIPDAL